MIRWACNRIRETIHIITGTENRNKDQHTTTFHTITTIKRTTSSANGNPAYIITFEDGTKARTQTGTSWAYEVDNSMIGHRYNFTMTNTGRIRYARKV